jgi:hypothetical protein
MSPSRRAVLLGCGVGLAGVGGLGYRYRRRHDSGADLEPLERALETGQPTVDPAPPVSLDHATALFDRVDAAVDEAEAATDGSLSVEHTENSPSTLEDATDTERRTALETYHDALGEAYRVRAAERHDDSAADAETLEDRLEAELEALADLEYGYRENSLTGTVVEAGTIDRRHADATSRVESPDSPLYGRTEYVRAWRFVGLAEAERNDAEHFLEARAERTDDDATAYEAAIEAAHERLYEESDELLDDVVWERAGTRTRAADLDVEWELSPGLATPTTERLEDGYPALALRRESRRYTHVRTLEVFEEIPARGYRDDHEWTVDAEATADRRRAAVDAISRTDDSHGEDPLGEWLLSTAIELLEQGDARLEALVDRANELPEDELRGDLEVAFLHVREAEAFAEAIPETLALVTE